MRQRATPRTQRNRPPRRQIHQARKNQEPAARHPQRSHTRKNGTPHRRSRRPINRKPQLLPRPPKRAEENHTDRDTRHRHRVRATARRQIRPQTTLQVTLNRSQPFTHNGF